MRLTTTSLIVNSPVTLSANWISSPIWAGHAVHFSIYLSFTGVPEGVFSLEYSNDANDSTNTSLPVNFARVEGSQQAVTTAGTHGWSVQNAGYRWLRVKFTYTTGTGSLTVANYNSKGA